MAIKIQVISHVDKAQPGWVECRFYDAWDKEHTIHEKVPIVTNNILDENSEYPQEGIIACEFIEKWVDQTGREIYTVSTDKPWDIETIDGLNKFDLLCGQLVEIYQFRSNIEMFPYINQDQQ